MGRQDDKAVSAEGASSDVTGLQRAWAFPSLRRPVQVLAALVFIVILLPPVMKWFHLRGGVWWLHLLLVSSLLSFLVTPLVKRLAFRFNILDIPDPRKIHLKPIPLIGGLSIYLAFIVSVLSIGFFSKAVVAILIGSSLVFITGLLDDVLKLSSRIRLVIQLLAVTVLLMSDVSIVIFHKGLIGTTLNALITCLWIIGLTNAMNFFDGMDGLASGLSIQIAFFMGMVAFQTNQPFLGWLSIAIMGGCIGFLPYNFGPRKPAEIFLGDAGSNFLGFTLASIAVMGEWSEKTIPSLATPLLIFSVLIYDMIYITVNRFATGKVSTIREWLDYVGKDHIHHRMENLMQSKRKSVLFIYLISFTMGFNALLLINADTMAAVLLMAQVTCLLIGITVMEIAGNKSSR